MSGIMSVQDRGRTAAARRGFIALRPPAEKRRSIRDRSPLPYGRVQALWLRPRRAISSWTPKQVYRDESGLTTTH